MAEISLDKLKGINGFLAASLIDTDSGMGLAYEGSGVDLELNAAVTTQIYKAIGEAITALKMDDVVEDTLVSLEKTYQLFRPLSGDRNLIIHLALDRSKGNLAMARRVLQEYEKNFEMPF